MVRHQAKTGKETKAKRASLLQNDERKVAEALLNHCCLPAQADPRTLGWGRCWLFEHCPRLLSTWAGAATFSRMRMRKYEVEAFEGIEDQRTPLQHLEPVSLGLSPSLAESTDGKIDNRQLCVDEGKLQLQDACTAETFFKVKVDTPHGHRAARLSAGSKDLVSIPIQISWQHLFLCSGLHALHALHALHMCNMCNICCESV